MPFRFFVPPNVQQIKYKPFIIKPEYWRDGLIIRSPNWLGDAAMALPAMYLFKKIVPEYCGTFVVCPENLVAFYKSIPWINCAISIGDGHSALTNQQLNDIKKLRSGIGMLFVNSLKSAYYFKKAGVRRVFGASNGIRNIFLTKSFKVKWNKKNDYETCHQSYKYLHMLNSLGVDEWDKSLPKFEIPSNCLDLKNILLVQPGASYGRAKRWPEEYFGKVCKWWIDEMQGDVVLVGTNKETKTVEKVIEYSTHNRNIYNFAGKTDLIQLMSLIQMSKICICNDSGVMHLSSILNKNGVAVFGSTDPFATGPIMGKWVVLLNKQKCSPCFSRECKNDEHDYRCLTSVTPDLVKNALIYTLNN